MYCIYCGRLADYDETRACRECKHKIAVINQRAYLLSLLKEAYPHVSSIRLRKKIEAVFQKEHYD